MSFHIKIAYFLKKKMQKKRFNNNDSNKMHKMQKSNR